MYLLSLIMGSRSSYACTCMKYLGLNVALIELRLPQLSCGLLLVLLLKCKCLLEKTFTLIAPDPRRVVLIFVIHDDDGISERIVDFILCHSLYLVCLIVHVILIDQGISPRLVSFCYSRNIFGGFSFNLL